jgi:DEAD/DEAH box helicase domain-containing protein
VEGEVSGLEFLGSRADEVVHVAEVPPRRGRFLEPQERIHRTVLSRLQEEGVAQFYVHQALAIDAALRGQDVAVVTGTSSGKTLCYNVPALHAVLSEPDARALYLFPTKALAHDQAGKLQKLLPEGVYAATYDGDTPKTQRSAIRRTASIVLTNPDMLHVGILPSHELWAKFLRTVRYVVVDEMHVYRGVFGSHVGNVLRRLLRLCSFHRNEPTVIGCSATIGNPLEVFRKLTGRTPLLVDDDTAPQAKRTFVFWNPPMLDDGSRLSANSTTAEVVTMLAEGGMRTLAFCRARVTTELVLRQVRQRLAKREGRADWVESYRGGYTPKERRQIEQALFKGKLRGLITTNAMELGVDVGSLDAVVMNTYPGSVASFWQQAGRAGRGAKPGLVVMIGHDDPLEQYLLREPDSLLRSTVESVALDPGNPTILAQQLKCAAHEKPLLPSEIAGFGDRALEVAEFLDATGDLHFRGGAFYLPSFDSPASQVNIRSAGGAAVLLYVEGELLGSMERWRALQYAHEGAVYLHRGESYVVESLDLEAGRATLRQEQTLHYTQPTVQSTVEQVKVLGEPERSGDVEVSLAAVRVTDLVLGFKAKSLDGERTLGIYDLDLPAEEFDTFAVRLDLPSLRNANPIAMEEDETASQAYLEAIHGVEHALMAVAPLIAGCDRGDLGSSWFGVAPDTLRPAIYVFDRTPGGVGLAERLITDWVEWFGAAHRLLRGCACEDGCPGCLLSSRCEANNEMLDKRGATDLLGRMCA